MMKVEQEDLYPFKDEVYFKECSPIYQVPASEMKQAPHSLIGAITFKKANSELGKGTGMLLSPSIVLTTAHSVCEIAKREIYREVKFYPGLYGALEKGYQIEDFFFPGKYVLSKGGPANDYALLKLREKVEETKFLRLGGNISQISNKTALSIFGYPGSRYSGGTKNSKIQEAKQFGLSKSGKIIEIDQQKAVIYHQISTEAGQSGAPIIAENENGEQTIIGIHKGGQRKLLNDVFMDVNIGRLLTPELVKTLKFEANRMGGQNILQSSNSEQKQQLDFKMIFSMAEQAQKHMPQGKTVSQRQYRKKSAHLQNQDQQQFDFKQKYSMVEQRQKLTPQQEKIFSQKHQINGPSFLQKSIGKRNPWSNEHKKQHATTFEISLIQKTDPNRINNYKFIYSSIKGFSDKNIDKVELLFKASDYKFSAHAFHHFCDNFQDTLVLARTNFGKIIGGFSHYKWNSVQNSWLNDNARRTCLFSLNPDYSLTPKRDTCLIRRQADKGPCFGNGEFWIADQCNQKASTLVDIGTNMGYTYGLENGNKLEYSQETRKKFSGVQEGFKVKINEYEVFKIVYGTDKGSQNCQIQ